MRTESKTQRIVARVGVVAALMAALPAFAEEHAESPGGPFEGNFGVALWTLVIFGIVVFVLGKFAWGPILGGLQAREKFIRESLESAKRDREAAEARLKEYSDKLSLAEELLAQGAGKILEREINPADHDRLIRDSIQALADGKRN